MTSGAGAATSDPKPAPIVIGDLCTCSGGLQSGITVQTLQAWESWVNAHGGIKHHRVSILFQDDMSDPAVATSEVEELLEQDRVIAIFDNSNEDVAWANQARKAHVPILGGEDSAIAASNPDVFPPGGTLDRSAFGSAQFVKRAGVKKMAILYCSEAAACLQSSNLTRTAYGKIGIRVVYTVSIAFGAPNYAAQCLAAQQAGATAMLVADASTIVAKVATDCAAQGYYPVQVNGDGTVSISWLTVPAMNGNIDQEPNIPWFVRDSATKSMYAAMAKYAPAVLDGPNFGENVVQTWAVGAELQAAAGASRLGVTPTSNQILSGLYAMTGTTLGGLSPPLKFARGKVAENGCYSMVEIKKGKFADPYGPGFLCVKAHVS
jgi:branched-chain amino acid transport system substrate-binding protein